jgi:hypothetical protein
MAWRQYQHLNNGSVASAGVIIGVNNNKSIGVISGVK